MATKTVILPHSETTNIVLGSIHKYSRIDVFGGATRGADKAVIDVIVQSIYTDHVEANPAQINRYDNIGLSFDTDYDESNIILKCTVDNSVEVDVTFSYNLKLVRNKNKVLGELKAYQKDMTFWGGEFDFVNNLWLDVSGNNNDAVLKNASARTSLSGDLDYTITGILTSDTVEVVSGSDTPTIPVNGTLRITEGQTVYGVTIKRAGEVWAIIPFCEPIWESYIPQKSYDVSGNRRHASATVIEDNITTQNDYFYLMEHGYTYGEQLHEDYDLQDDVSGVPKNWSAGSGYAAQLKSTWMGDYWRFEHNGINITFTGNFYKSGIAALNVFSTYFLIKSIRRINQTVLTGFDYEGTHGTIKCLSHYVSGNYYIYNSTISTSLFQGTASEWITTMGFFTTVGTHKSTYFAVNPYINGNTITPTTIDLKRIVICLPYIVPAELNGLTSATGFEIEVTQDGSSFLRYAGSLQFADTTINQNTKPIYSSLIKSGILESGETYLIERNDNSIFSGNIHGEIISDGSEMPDADNYVRKVLSDSLLYTDTTPNVLTYNDIYDYNAHLSYTEKTRDYISKLIILKGSTWLTNDVHSIILSYVNIRESIRGKYLQFWFDSFDDTKFGAMVDALDTINIKTSMAINIGNTLSEENVTLYKTEGHDVEVHSQTSLATYKGWNDKLTYYNSTELRAYYAELISYHISKGWGAPTCKVYPGGGYDKTTTEIASEYFNQGRLVGQDFYTNKHFTDDWYKTISDYALYKKWYKIGAISTDDLKYNVWKASVDLLIALDEGFGGIYIHMANKDITAKYNDDGDVDAGGETFIQKIIKLFNYCATNGIRVIPCRSLHEIVTHIT